MGRMVWGLLGYAYYAIREAITHENEDFIAELEQRKRLSEWTDGT